MKTYPFYAVLFLVSGLLVHLYASEAGAMIDPRVFNRHFDQIAKTMKLDKAPRFLKGFAPQYPRGMVFQEKKGQAVVDFVIAADGTAQNIKVVQSSDDRITQEVVRVVSQWKFKPAEKDGKPVGLSLRLPISLSP